MAANDTARHSGQSQPMKLLPEHPMALGAQRLVSDQTVAAFFNRLEAAYTFAALQGATPQMREENRLQLLALYGLLSTLQNFAKGQIPQEFREANADNTNYQPN